VGKDIKLTASDNFPGNDGGKSVQNQRSPTHAARSDQALTPAPIGHDTPVPPSPQ
jgi:hypothetical protein